MMRERAPALPLAGGGPRKTRLQAEAEELHWQAGYDWHSCDAPPKPWCRMGEEDHRRRFSFKVSDNRLMSKSCIVCNNSLSVPGE
jgi:hypothetical protein